MLPAQYRLRRETDFHSVYKGGKARHSALFRIIVLKNNLKNSRFGIVISNKTAKSAVQRNRVKRQIRAAINEILLEIQSGYDIVLIAKPAICKATGNEIRGTVAEQVRRILNNRS